MDVTIDAATMDDVDAVTSQWVALVEGQREYGAHLLGSENETAARSVIEQYVHADGLGVAREEGTAGSILGFVMFHVDRGMYEQDVGRGILENLYVIPGRRGEGIGSLLLDYGEAALKDEGVDVISISVMADNSTVRDWYLDRGYSPHRITLERSVDEDAT